MRKLIILTSLLLFLVPIVTASYDKNFTQPLAAGWNLVSTPLILENPSIDNVVGNNDKIDKIFYFDGDNWLTWVNNLRGNTLSTMEPLKGYWVYTTEATNITFYGDLTIGVPPGSYGMMYPISLDANKWYMIGYYSTNYIDDTDTDDALTGLCATGGLCSAGYANFDYLMWYDTDNSLLNSTIQSEWDSDALWDRGRGFWIHMTASDVLRGTP